MTQKPADPRPRNPLQVGHGAPSMQAQASLASAEADDQDSDSFVTIDAATELGKIVATPPASDTDEGWLAGHTSAFTDYANKKIQKLSDNLSMAEAVRQVTKGLSIRFICVCGLSGAGKSSFIRLVTGKPVHVEHSIKSGTTTFAMFPATIHGQRFVFVDTPGFDDRDKSDSKILEIILEWFETMTPYVDLAGIVYVHDITKDRFGGAAESNIELLRAMAGPAFYNRITFVTTKWDTMANKVMRKAETRQRELEEGPWEDMIDSGAKVVRLHFADDDDEPDVVEKAMIEARETMSHYIKARKCCAAIQKELRKKIPKEETSAAMVLLGKSEPPPRYEDDTLTTAEELEEAVPLLRDEPIEQREEQQNGWWGQLVRAVMSFLGIRK